MSWKQLPGEPALWEPPAQKNESDNWYYVNEEDGAYVRATPDLSITSRTIGDTLLFLNSISPKLAVGSATMQGARPNQEDRIWVQETDFLPYCDARTAHLMVADGHVGDCAAEFAIRRLPSAARQILQEAIATWIMTTASRVDNGTSKPIGICPEEPTEAPPPSPPQDENRCGSPAKKKRWRESDLPEKDISPPSKFRRKTDHPASPVYLDDFHYEEFQKVLAGAMKVSYASVDGDFLRMNKTSTSGSTCSSVTILGRIAIFANIGDSRMVLVTHPSKGNGELEEVGSNNALRMSFDHKPGQLDEKTRIEEAGGTVRRLGGCWRVLPDMESGSRTGVALAVSRSFGDKSLKKYVISEPQVTVVRLDPKVHAAIIIATDGVWDTVDDRHAAELVYANHESRNATQAARTLTRVAYQAGSEVQNQFLVNNSSYQDNISCAVAFIYED